MVTINISVSYIMTYTLKHYDQVSSYKTASFLSSNATTLNSSKIVSTLPFFTIEYLPCVFSDTQFKASGVSRVRVNVKCAGQCDCILRSANQVVRLMSSIFICQACIVVLLVLITLLLPHCLLISQGYLCTCASVQRMLFLQASQGSRKSFFVVLSLHQMV